MSEKASKQIEITEPMKLLKKDGSLTQPGWCRNNIIEYNREDIAAPKLRIKEWDYYQIGCKDWSVELNFFNISLASSATVGFIDMKTGKRIDDSILDFVTVNRFQVNRNGEKPYEFTREKDGKKLCFTVTENERHLYWKSDALEVDFTLQNYKGENICVMTPFEKRSRFFFTEKINCMPAKGFVKVGDTLITTEGRDDVFGLLDWGRGPWPHKNFWFWGNGTKYIDDKLFGFEITWGIGIEDSATETALFYDGKCHKLGRVSIEREPDGRWDEPWVFHEENGRFELTLTPFLVDVTTTEFGPIKMECHKASGYYNGTVTLDDGTVFEIKDMYAFCEKVYNNW